MKPEEERPKIRPDRTPAMQARQLSHIVRCDRQYYTRPGDPRHPLYLPRFAIREHLFKLIGAEISDRVWIDVIALQWYKGYLAFRLVPYKSNKKTKVGRWEDLQLRVTPNLGDALAMYEFEPHDLKMEYVPESEVFVVETPHAVPYLEGHTPSMAEKKDAERRRQGERQQLRTQSLREAFLMDYPGSKSGLSVAQRNERRKSNRRSKKGKRRAAGW